MSQPTSPRANVSETAHHASTWQPHDMAYSEAFEDAVCHVLQNPPPGDGITVLPNASSDEPQSGASVRALDIDSRSLPDLSLHQLPLPLDDERRKYASPIPGIRLTHPGGYFEGGPGAPVDVQGDFARNFIAEANINDPDQLALEIQDHMTQNTMLAKARMHARYEAQQHNARIEREIKTLMDQREMEVKIETRMKEDAARRRETREKRKMAAV